MEFISEVQGGVSRDAFLGGEEYSIGIKQEGSQNWSQLQLQGMHDERWGRSED